MYKICAISLEKLSRLFMGGIFAYVDREPVTSPVLCIAVQKKVARGAACAATIISKYLPSVQPNLL